MLMHEWESLSTGIFKSLDGERLMDYQYQYVSHENRLI